MSIYECHDPNLLKKLFKNESETMILSYLQGCEGRAYVDHRLYPQSAQIIVGDFCFFGGIVHDELLLNVCDSLILVPQDESWARRIENLYKEKVHKRIRYALLKKKNSFRQIQYKDIIDSLPQPYHMKKIDISDYYELLSHQWSKDLCLHFENKQDYFQHGFGFVIVYDNEIVAGVSSYTYYHSGIEIEIDTREDHRQKGLAKCLGAQMILECLNRNIYPSWDAHNPVSLHLSLQLGYHFDREYEVYEFVS